MEMSTQSGMSYKKAILLFLAGAGMGLLGFKHVVSISSGIISSALNAIKTTFLSQNEPLSSNADQNISNVSDEEITAQFSGNFFSKTVEKVKLLATRALGAIVLLFITSPKVKKMS